MRRLSAVFARLRGRIVGTRGGPYDLSLVEGSITTAHDTERILKVRRQSKHLVTIGACATAGGIQALRNFADVNDFIAAVYASPQFIKTLATSTPISAHVPVDFELHGCPINKAQLIEVISAFLAGRKPAIATHSVCIECKRNGTVCVMVQGIPCLGPVTHAGCGAICPANGGRWAPLRAICGVFFALSTRPPSRLRPRVKPMATKTIRVDYLTRIEGEGGLDLRISDGRVTSAQLNIFEPPRFFEAFLRGRGYAETPDLVARICGICPIAYQMSAVHAIEHAFGVTVDGQLRALRRLIYCASTPTWCAADWP